MKLSFKYTALLLAVTLPSTVSAKDFSRNKIEISLDLLLDLQTAAFDDGRTNTDSSATNIDWTARLNTEYRADDGWIVGFRFEVDQNFDADKDQASSARNVRVDEVYGYVSSRFGRIEIGEQDGPSDTLSFHAPIVGTGQIHGDFARYVSGQARLKPFDSRDSLKTIYISPPLGGLRFGVSWGPHLRRNRENPVLRRRTIQRDPVELGVQYQAPLGKSAVLGISGAYVHANSLPETGRENIKSWSVGSELRINRLRFGGAYVSRGDSNSFIGRNEDEINAGVAWSATNWSLGSSFAHIKRSTLNRDLGGLGGWIKISDNVTLRSDLVYFDDQFSSGTHREGVVGIVDLRLHY